MTGVTFHSNLTAESTDWVHLAWLATHYTWRCHGVRVAGVRCVCVRARRAFLMLKEDDGTEIEHDRCKRTSAAVKLVTNTSQWRKIGTRGSRRKGRGSVMTCASFAINSERQSFFLSSRSRSTSSHKSYSRVKNLSLTSPPRQFSAGLEGGECRNLPS
ncbi:hypothetical protein EVAR_91521_1 [Eumeta japonica]|uniref:Uncharacterized protein n=1 Tax=Eumeta variegata TaxID=151549 RepID=A0A4C1VBR7_EUMVA|nr:hypothetical protein EVAR_91521_1 [Eumeta japonica]